MKKPLYVIGLIVCVMLVSSCKRRMYINNPSMEEAIKYGLTSAVFSGECELGGLNTDKIVAIDIWQWSKTPYNLYYVKISSYDCYLGLRDENGEYYYCGYYKKKDVLRDTSSAPMKKKIRLKKINGLEMLEYFKGVENIVLNLEKQMAYNANNDWECPLYVAPFGMKSAYIDLLCEKNGSIIQISRDLWGDPFCKHVNAAQIAIYGGGHYGYYKKEYVEKIKKYGIRIEYKGSKGSGSVGD